MTGLHSNRFSLVGIGGGSKQIGLTGLTEVVVEVDTKTGGVLCTVPSSASSYTTKFLAPQIKENGPSADHPRTPASRSHHFSIRSTTD